MTSISKKTWSGAWAFQKKLLTFAPQIIEKYMGEYLHISDNMLASKRIYNKRYRTGLGPDDNMSLLDGSG